MKKYLLLILSAILFAPCMLAQEKQDKAKMMEDLQKFKIDFLAKEMGLSEKEKAEFTPIYKEYDTQRRNAGARAWKFERELKKKKDASEADYKRLAEVQQAARDKDNEIVKDYDARFETFLSAKQIYIMHKGEEKFFEKMKEMRKKHGDRPDKEPGKHNHSGKDKRHDSRFDDQQEP